MNEVQHMLVTIGIRVNSVYWSYQKNAEEGDLA